MNELRCPSCGRPLASADVNLQTALARCGRCDKVFSVGAGAPAAAPVGRPASVQQDDQLGRFELTLRWFTWLAIFLVFFCIAWDSFLVVWHGASIAFLWTGEGPGAGWSLFSTLFSLPHTIIGIVLPYYTLALFVNRTKVRLSDGELTVRHGPLWWPGSRTVRTDQVSGLRQDVSYGRRGAETYTLAVRLRDGTEQTLLRSDDKAAVTYIGQTLAGRLGVGLDGTSAGRGV